MTVPWKLLTTEGWDVYFATEETILKPSADEVTLHPPKLLSTLGADVETLEWYKELQEDSRYNSPIKWADLKMDMFDALLLPGGHAPGMKQYLESKVLQDKISQFWQLHRPVAAICHGKCSIDFFEDGSF